MLLSTKEPIDIKQIRVAYSCHIDLGNLLSSRNIHILPGTSVSFTQSEIRKGLRDQKIERERDRERERVMKGLRHIIGRDFLLVDE